ncbi:L-type lectin-domain containing receptor kinase S.4 [Camellia lanceoleosa]|uniref:L-type lectin-domain containing receptor kinase S.4 n=1 Tax=Camellia lanceoleosa TaxID=1840588 RepID=A0ACC0IV61_9ERIC|nr:L-type lectin-domain containing receptor kinase S.4 [Camellia lanceoleosa]
MQSINLKSGNTIQAWIDYDSAKNELNVSLSLSSTKPSSSILTFQIDLSLIFEDTMYVGFSASTEGSILEVVDPRLGGEFDEIEVVVVLKLGLMCSNNVQVKRPSMRQVVRYLEGEVGLPEVVAPPEEKGGGGGGVGGGIEFEDFVHSYPSSSNFEKVSGFSSGGDGDVETGCGGSPVPLAGGRNGS